jgi:hypothetical protein
MHTLRPDHGQSTTQGFWSVVKANITPEGRGVEAKFSEWWSEEHVPEYVARPGFSSGRLLTQANDAAPGGEGEHEYLAVYVVDTVATFNAALSAGPPWGAWQADIDRYLCDWERTYYRHLSVHEVSSSSGAHLAIVKVDFAGTDTGREAEFNDWYGNKHVPELCAHPGFHRAWRLEVEPDENDLGPRRQRYWAVYEVDTPADFKQARATRAESGIPAWDGLWADDLVNVEMSHYRLLSTVEHAEAVAKTEARGVTS